MTSDEKLKQAMEGDIKAFQELFFGFQSDLKSYLFRLLANRSDADDITHDTFIKAFDQLSTFQKKSSLKTWVFTIATNLAYNYLKRRNKWTADVSEKAKSLVMQNRSLAQSIERVNSNSEYGRYEIKEHIDTCFTCISKNLDISNQVALILKDVYDFKVKEIVLIMNRSEGSVKYLIQLARKEMTSIFDRRCALVNKNGVCHQCSELNGWFNPKQNQKKAIQELNMVKKQEKASHSELYKMRANLVKAIDPLRSEGHELQEILLNCNRMAMGEIEVSG